jgi:hypothetical protein
LEAPSLELTEAPLEMELFAPFKAPSLEAPLEMELVAPFEKHPLSAPRSLGVYSRAPFSCSPSPRQVQSSTRSTTRPTESPTHNLLRGLPSTIETHSFSQCSSQDGFSRTTTDILQSWIVASYSHTHRPPHSCRHCQPSSTTGFPR